MMNFYKEEKIPESVILSEGTIQFRDVVSFVTCYSPLRMIELGIFGLGYFGIRDVDKSSLNNFLVSVPEFSGQIDDEIKSKIYSDPQVFSQNCYGIKAGLDYSYWQDNEWIHPDDPYGWFNWYIQFYYGRRHEDDFRQIRRYRSFVKRHWGMLKGYCQKAGIPLEQAENRYQKTCQGLLQWGWNYRMDPNKTLS